MTPFLFIANKKVVRVDSRGFFGYFIIGKNFLLVQKYRFIYNFANWWR